MTSKLSSHFGQYQILRLLGRGGMGEVYEVQHLTLGRQYALKLLPPEFATQPDALARFRREARVMANLEHPNIVRVDDFGETEERYWLRMELVKGVEIGAKAESGSVGARCITLGDYATSQGGRIGQAEFAVILKQMLEALAYAHEAGVVHRDLKPGNILLETDANGRMAARVADFGLARVVGDEFLRNQAQMSMGRNVSLGEAKTLGDEGTSTRALVGTWEYMAPEQRRGEAADARSDVYAMGLICYRLLTGKALGLKLPSELVPGLDAQWDRFVAGAVEQDPAARYANGREMLAAAASVLSLMQGLLEHRSAEEQQRSAAEAAQRASEAEQRAAAEATQVREAEELRQRAAKEQARRKQLDQLKAEAQRKNEERMDEVALQWAKLRLFPWPWAVLGLALLAFVLTLFQASPSVWPAIVVMLLGVITARMASGAKWPASVAVALGLVMTAVVGYPRYAQRRSYPAESSPQPRQAQVGGRTAGSPARATSASKWYLSFRTRRYTHSYGNCTGVAFVPGGRFLAIAGTQGIELWDLESATVCRTLPDWLGRASTAIHSGSYKYMSLPADGKLLACAVGSYSALDASLFDLRTGEMIRTFPRDEQESEVTSLALSPNGQRLACTYKSHGGALDYVKVWDARTGELLRQLAVVKQSTTGQTAASAYSVPRPTPPVSIADRYGNKTASSRTVRRPTYASDATTEEATTVAFAPDGKTLACGYKFSSGGALIRLWNVEDGKLVRQSYTPATQASRDERVVALAFSPDGGSLACGIANCGSEVRFAELRLWNTEPANSKPVPIQRSAQAGSYTEVLPTALSFSPDGRYLACSFKRSGAPWEIRMWDVRMNTALPPMSDPTSDLTQSSPKSVAGLSFSPDGESLAIGFEERSGQKEVLFELREPRSGKIRRRFTADDMHRSFAIRALAVSPDNLTLACGVSGPASRAEVTLIQPGHGTQPRQVPEASSNPVNFSRLELVSALAFLPGNSKLVCGYDGPDSDDALKIWDAQTGVVTQTLACPPTASGGGSNRWSVVSLSAAPNGKTLLCACKDPQNHFEARLWDLEKGTLLYRSPVEVSPPDAIVFTGFSATSQPLCCAYGGIGVAGRLSLTDPKTGKLVKTIETASAEYDTAWTPTTAALSPDGVTLLCAYTKMGETLGSRPLIVWDISGTELHKVAEENVYASEGAVTALCFYNNGGSFACGLGDGELKQWDMAAAGQTAPGASAIRAWKPPGAAR